MIDSPIIFESFYNTMFKKLTKSAPSGNTFICLTEQYHKL